MTGWGASEWTGVAQIGALLVMLAVVHRPLGDYMATVFTTPRHLAVERAVYRVTGVGADREQRWPSYLRAVLVFSLLGVLLVFGFQRLQAWLPLSMGMEPVPPDLAWNTAISFVTNTNWQSYSGEATMSTLTQMAALAVQNFLSAAVGLAVVIALIRGLARHGTDLIGNFWVDLTRGVVRILLPLSVLFAIVLLLAGVVQNLNDPTTVTTLTGTEQTIPGGTVASQEAIKLLGTNGGGYFNANSAHPFENPTSWTNLLQIFLLLLIPSALPRTFGRMVGSLKQGYAVLAAMGVLWVLSLAAVVAAELSQQGGQAGGVGATGTTGVGMEGRDTRFGLIPSALFAVSTTLTSTGAVDSFHSSYSPLGGGTLILNMLLGEIAPGGVGSGLYGMLVVAILGVFICGLMVGRTPEYLGKKVGATQIKLISLYLLATPLTVLVGSAIAFALPATQDSLLNPGSHGFSEVLYAFTSAGNNNGSAFAGLAADTPFFNVALGLAMVIGRFLPIVMVLALAGSFAIQQRVPASAGTLPTHTPLFVGVMVGTALIVTALAYLPALALGPLAEAL